MPKIPKTEFEKLPLHVHQVLAAIPLKDAWAVDLGHSRPGITLHQFLKVSPVRSIGLSKSARSLFWLRRQIGMTFGWDRQSTSILSTTFLSRVAPGLRDQSLIAPGTLEGSFRVVYSLPNEHLAELRNKLVHGALSVALVEEKAFYRLYLGVFVLSLNRFTPFYMASISPFRDWIVYPSILNNFRKRWNECFGVKEEEANY